MEYNVKVISDGIAFGKLLNRVHSSNTVDLYGYNPDEELEKFSKAIDECYHELIILKESMGQYTDISFIDAHMMIVKDPTLFKDVKKILFNESCNVEYAFSKAIDVYIDMIRETDDEYLKERYLDLKDIKCRVLNSLYTDIELSDINEDTIIYVDEVFPSMIININPYVKGIISKQGGFTSHSAILCNAKGIVYVIANEIDIKNGQDVILDGINEKIYVNPSDKTIKEYKEMIEQRDNIDLSDINKERFNIYANVSTETEVNKTASSKLDGIGLYRSEYIFMGRNDLPSIEEQEKIYFNALKNLYPRMVVIRTLDFGDDKSINCLVTNKKGVSNYFKYYKIFENQVRALVRSNKFGNLKIIFPMVETNDEFIKLRDIVLRVKEEEKNNNELQIGIMLETKKALENIDDFIDVDFMSIGTNDLVNQLYGIKRDSLADYKIYIDKLVNDLTPVINLCNNKNIDLCLCGAIAGVPKGLKKLIDAGIKSFSVNFNALPTIYNVLKKYTI